MDLARLALQNPWWADPAALDRDPHLQALQDLPLKIRWPLSRRLRLHEHRLYILRGPRQIGKTTLMKSLIARLIREGVPPRRILYFALDIGGIRSARDLQDLLATYLQFSGGESGALRWVFLDEVTYTPEWAVGIKAAYDLGLLRSSWLLVSGSSTLDLKAGGERLPGRRGLQAHENDLVLLPLGFREYLEQLGHRFPRIQTLEPEEVYEVAQQIAASRAPVDHLPWYLLTGGFPLSINAYLRDRTVPPEVYHTYQTAILGDLLRVRKRETFAREILQVLLQKRFEPVDWSGLAQETGIGSHVTAREYVETLEALFLLRVVPAVRSLGSPQISLRKRRKIYFLDPFLLAASLAWVEGDVRPFSRFQAYLADPLSRAKVLEGVVGNALAASLGPVRYWRNQGEVDFIVVQGNRILGYVEVKDQARIRTADLRSLRKAGGGILLSRNTLELNRHPSGTVAVVPIPYFLAALAQRPVL